MYNIKFGTDGWRDVIGQNFTFGRLRRVVRGMSAWLKSREGGPRQVLIGHDTRFFSRRFAEETAAVLAAEGFDPLLSTGVVPTPCLSWNVKQRGAACGVMITSSHNPGRYNGFKVKLTQGCSAFEEQTALIERASQDASEEPVRRAPGRLRQDDFLGPYLECLRARVDWKLLSRARFKIVSDSMHGAAGSLLADHFSSSSLRVLPFRSQPDPLFGGVQPEPVGANMLALQKEVVQERAAAGLAHDGDADRVGLVDENGDIVNAHQFLGLLLDHYVRTRGCKGEAVRTFSGTQLVDSLCQSHGIPLHETAVGFKHIARIMLQRPVLVGGEESNGFGFGDHLPERDGLLGGLILMEILAKVGKPLSAIIREMRRRYGVFHYDRVDLAVERTHPENLGAFFEAWQPERVAGLKVVGKSRLDGTKFLLEGGAWLLLRPSGTEPLVRLYSEAPSKKLVDGLLKAGQQAIKNFL